MLAIIACDIMICDSAVKCKNAYTNAGIDVLFINPNTAQADSVISWSGVVKVSLSYTRTVPCSPAFL